MNTKFDQYKLYKMAVEELNRRAALPELEQIRERWTPGARLTTWGPKEASKDITTLLSIIDETNTRRWRVGRVRRLWNSLINLIWPNPELDRAWPGFATNPKPSTWSGTVANELRCDHDFYPYIEKYGESDNVAQCQYCLAIKVLYEDGWSSIEEPDCAHVWEYHRGVAHSFDLSGSSYGYSYYVCELCNARTEKKLCDCEICAR